MNIIERALALQTVKAEEAGIEQEEAVSADAPLLPRQCRTYMRNKLAEAFPAIVAGFLSQAKQGNCQHVKLATALLEVPAEAKRASAEKRIVARWKKAMEECREDAAAAEEVERAG